MFDSIGKYWDKAWSLVEGCTPVSPGCKNCWLASMANRFKNKVIATIQNYQITNSMIIGFRGEFNGVVFTRPDRLDIPLKRKKPTVYAIWSDLFHENVPFEFSLRAFTRMKKVTQHIFLVLTKRPERALEFCGHWGLMPDHLTGFTGSGEKWPENVWIGTTAENQEMADKRIPELLKIPGKKFLSIEPMLGEIDITPYLSDVEDYGKDVGFKWHKPSLDWVIVGGETGSGARPMHPDWLRSIRDQCVNAGVPLFFKGWGEWAETQCEPGGDLGGDMRKGNVEIVKPVGEIDGHFREGDALMRRVGTKKAGRFLDGREWNELPWKK